MGDKQRMNGVIRAGVSQVDISPKAGMRNWDWHLPIEFVLDPLHARALVLERDGRKLCLIALDLIVINQHYSNLIREMAANRFGFEKDAIMTHALQIHSAPALGHFLYSEEFDLPAEFGWLRGGDDNYHPYAVERIMQVIEQAHSALEPVQMGVNSAVEGRVAFNRRMVMRDGSIGMPWLGGSPINPQFRYLEGPIDPELGVACFRSNSLRLLTMLVNYTCHPVNLHPEKFQKIVSADWPGAFASELRKTFGDQCIPVILNGACGDVNPWDPYDPNYVRDHRRMGRLLAETAEKIVQSLTYRDNVALDWRSKHLQIPIRKYSSEELRKAREMIRKHPKPLLADERARNPSNVWNMVDHEWLQSAAIVDRCVQSQTNPEFDYEVQVFRIGEAAFVGLPGEPFAEGGLQIKLKSPTFPTYIVHNTCFGGGYIPTKQAFKRGGYEATASRLVPEAWDMIEQAVTDLLEELFCTG